MLPATDLFLPPQTVVRLGLTQQAPVSQRPRFVVGELTVDADEMEWSAETLIHTMRGNIIATYGETKLRCAEAILDEKNNVAIFSTGVQIEDPVGTLSARELRLFFEVFGDKNERRIKNGVAIGIDGRAYEAKFRADEISMTPGKWILKNTSATNSTLTNPDYQIQAKELTIIPGEKISGKSVSLLLGKSFRVPIPFFLVRLQPQSGGIPYPMPTFDENFAFGYRFNYATPIGDRVTFLYDQRAKFNDVPGVNTQLVFSLLPRSQSNLLLPITVRNEDRERFLDSFLDNVTVASELNETDLVGQQKALLFAGRTTRISTRARLEGSEKLDREWYLGGEFGGQIGTVSGNVSIRYGDVQDVAVGADALRRVDVYATLGLLNLPISDQLSVRIRADGAMFFGDNSGYSWIRPQVGLQFRPSSEFQASVAYFRAESFGTPDFIADQLYSKNALHLRLDFHWKPTDLSLLFKYDFDKSDLYDVEVSLGQVLRSVRPFISYRSFPGSIAFGVTLRADNLLAALTRRSAKR